MNRPLFLVRCLAILCVAALAFHPADAVGAGLKDVTVLVIRHAEKPDDGDGLAPAGEARARAYVNYFQNFKLSSEPLKLTAIFAAADSGASRRPRLTVTPLATASGLALNTSYKDKAYQEMVNDLRSYPKGSNLLVCWHHGMMSELLQALGADPNALLPGGHWPGDAYDWVIALRYDREGHLQEARRIDEGLTGSR